MTEDIAPYDDRETEAAQALSAEATRQKRLVEESDFKFIMGCKQGRRFMWRCLSLTKLFSTPFAVQREVTDFNCGMQNVGQQLLAEIHGLCPERYIEMVKEQLNDERSRNRS